MGRAHPQVGLDRIGSGRVHLCGSVKVTLNDTECYAAFSEFIKSKFSMLLPYILCKLNIHE